MRILDLFCGAGGAAMGYHRAFPDAEIVGMDINPQPRYPFTFEQGDVMELTCAYINTFDFVHASPPCQDWSALKSMHSGHGTAHMLPETIARLSASDVPWVVENVPGSEAGMGGQFVTLCGSSFGLGVRRHRHFAASFLILSPPCRHREQGPPVGVSGHGAQGHEYRRGGPVATQADRRAAMGIDWMNRDELAQSIPPSYTEFIGRQYAATLECAT